MSHEDGNIAPVLLGEEEIAKVNSGGRKQKRRNDPIKRQGGGWWSWGRRDMLPLHFFHIYWLVNQSLKIYLKVVW